MIYNNESIFVYSIRIITEFCFGLITRIFDIFIKVKPKHWIFGADYGFSYRESSKYMIEYMIANHKDVHCSFITNSKEVKNDLDKKGIPCYLNNTLRGIFEISKADAVFVTQDLTDIRYAFKKKGRTYYYFTHGQAYKKCMRALPQNVAVSQKSLITKIRDILALLLSVDYGMSDVSFVPSTSEFLTPYMELMIGRGVMVKILGMPRNDRLFNDEEMKKEKWIDGIEGRTVITYMPTHRNYGKGELTPVPFEHNKKVQEWMRENNVVFIMKQHPNMMTKLDNPIDTDVIKDVTKMRLDPQVILFHTDILISDYSSVFIDFLLYGRPVVFYIYDNYADVEGNLYDIHDDFPNTFCYSEEELFSIIKKGCSKDRSVFPSEIVQKKYNKYSDANSSERFYKAVVEDKSYKK